MEETLYDEFGNYIGPEMETSSEESDYETDKEEEEEEETIDTSTSNPLNTEIGEKLDSMILGDNNEDNSIQESNEIILHEDKKYYPEAEEVYGEGTEALVMEEDAQTIETPIIASVKDKEFFISADKNKIETIYSNEFMINLMNYPELIRNISFIGDLHHGKTSFLDLIISKTLVNTNKKNKRKTNADNDKYNKFTDTRMDEKQRKISIKSTPISLVLQTTKGKSYLLNTMDCPGHVNFSDETTAALHITDGAILIIDAIEGVTMNTERLIKNVLMHRLPLVLIVNKFDRLIIELKLPATDAYYKILHTINSVNNIIYENTPNGEKPVYLLPEKGNVLFSSAQHHWCFSLQSFAKLYAEQHKGIDYTKLSTKLWGDMYYHPGTRNFMKKIPYEGAKRSFIQFILEPIYKIYSHVLGEEIGDLSHFLTELGMFLRRDELALNPKPLLQLIFTKLFGNCVTSLVDIVINAIPSPIVSQKNKKKINSIYTGYNDNINNNNIIFEDMCNCKSNGANLMINVVKLYNDYHNNNLFTCFGRVYSGEIKKNQKIKILGENYTIDDPEDMVITTITNISIVNANSTNHVYVNKVPAGNFVFIEGIDATIEKTATITDVVYNNNNLMENIYIFSKLKFDNKATFKIAVEPMNPAELPKMVDGLRRISKSYPLATTKVEESGEHVIITTGELAADCILHDLRHIYSDNVEVKKSDPVSTFQETCIDISSIQCEAESNNKRNKLTMIAEPLDTKLAKDIEKGEINIKMNKKILSDFFVSKYDWDLLASRSIWSFGDEENNNPNIFIDDVLPSNYEIKSLLNNNINNIKDSIIQGFQWACREGPLCDEPIRHSTFKLIDCIIDTTNNNIYSGGGQIIPTARRVVYSSFLTASPRLMEPIYEFEILCPADVVNSLSTVLIKRRGNIVSDNPICGSPLYSVKGYIPVIESFGFETDLRIFTQGQAFVQQVFSHWNTVPGDPLDNTIILRPLEPAPVNALAREFMIKTRRRKGLSDNVYVGKYFDQNMIQNLAKQDVDLNNIL